ncbi:hypothetical protein CY34DRAFT_17826 [Suillus luteus UH-Slu-Lm8-n1]|uniref:Uncharacterized protein n=1 Tax=Suillus luteus UH-Slu-Lm8-n1 TaxID=930992 RepID=A0A0C9ZXR7_9AGAM|nr:hypothetical protein CY34DRAFT_17826 [Suillus luteus UH-Slu-Lm8-n1]
MDEVESWDVSRETNGIILGVISAGGVGGKFTAMGVSWPMFSAASGRTSMPSVCAYVAKRGFGKGNEVEVAI